MNNILFQPAWIKTKEFLKKDRADLVEQLIASESPEIRGRIKQIDEILERYPIELVEQIETD